MSNHGETPGTRNLPGPTVEEATRQKEDFELRAHEALEAFREKQRPMEMLPEEWEAKLVEAKLIDQAREVDSTDLEAYLTALASLQAGAHNINFPRELRPVFVARCDALYVTGEFRIQDLPLPEINAKCVFFADAAWFVNASFSGHAKFQGATFGGMARFEGATFSEMSWFDGATFSHFGWFDEVAFSDGVSFDRATFSADVDFSRAAFSMAAGFRGATFSGGVNFIGATFSAEKRAMGAMFDSAAFYSTAWFDKATFCCRADFRRATFSYDAWFSGATFSEDVEFNEARFSGTAWFDRATFSGMASFEGAPFHTGASFTKSNFNGAANFAGCHFFGAPLFHDSKLSQDSSFFRAEFDPPKESNQFKEWTDADRRAFRTLKLLMTSQRAQHEEAMFFALEARVQRVVEYQSPWQRRLSSRGKQVWSILAQSTSRTTLGRSVIWGKARREPRGPTGYPFLWLISCSYDVVSRYGQSPSRAFGMFFLWNAAFGALFWTLRNLGPVVWAAKLCVSTLCLGVPSAKVVAFVDSSKPHALNDSPSVALTLQNALNPLALLSEKALVMVENASVLTLSLVQSIGSLAILALLLLAIRARFQKGGGGGGSA